jgi:2-oxo-4-hydroxy-4-carboxy-5-ureidoimidazoline decarboxylase
MTIEDLNSKDLAGFIEAVGWVFEHSPWVASRVWAKRPFATVGALHAAMEAEVASADPEQQLSVLRAHPELGARAEMSEASQTEQAGAGLRELPRAELERLQRLTSSYRTKFGFPFLYAVKGATSQTILNALEARLASTREAEHAEALRQAGRIARFRLEEMMS